MLSVGIRGRVWKWRITMSSQRLAMHKRTRTDDLTRDMTCLYRVVEWIQCWNVLSDMPNPCRGKST